MELLQLVTLLTMLVLVIFQLLLVIKPVMQPQETVVHMLEEALVE